MDKREELQQRAITAALEYGDVRYGAGVMEGTGDPAIEKEWTRKQDKARGKMVSAINALAESIQGGADH